MDANNLALPTLMCLQAGLQTNLQNGWNWFWPGLLGKERFLTGFCGTFLELQLLG